jgi:uncharacterized protein
VFTEPTRLSNDLFTINTDEGTTLIVSPHRGGSMELPAEEYALIADALVAENPAELTKPPQELAQRLYDAGLLPPQVEAAWGFRPVIRMAGALIKPVLEFKEDQIRTVVLNLTSVCNLGCSYCHSNVDGLNQKMPLDILDGALLILKRTAQATGQKVTLELLGSGENLVAPDLVKRVCEKVVDMRAEGIKIHLSVVTNATLITDENLAWMAPAVDVFSVSWDGDREIMDTQRATKGGGSVYDRMMESFATFRRHQVYFTLRATVSAMSVSRLPAMVQLAADDIFKDVKHSKSISIEPITSMGRGDELSQPDVVLFNQKFWEARDLGRTLGINVVSGLVFPTARAVYCGVPGPMMVVTPDGNLASCSRISKPSDPTWDYFHFGNFSHIDQKFNFNEAQINKFRALSVDDHEECRECFFKAHCTGGCYALREEGKESFTCKVSKHLGREFLIRRHRMNAAKDLKKSEETSKNL